MAKALFIDKYNFSHMFKQNMQISFYQYVIQQRLLEAKRLLMKKNRSLPSRPNAVFLIITPFTAPSKRITVSIRVNMSPIT